MEDVKCVALECRGERWESLWLISLRKLNIDQPQNPSETHDRVLTENLQSLFALYDSNYAAPFFKMCVFIAQVVLGERHADV